MVGRELTYLCLGSQNVSADLTFYLAQLGGELALLQRIRPGAMERGQVPP